MWLRCVANRDILEPEIGNQHMEMELIGEVRTKHEIRMGWWIETRASVRCALPKDGLLVVYNRATVEAIFDKHYPHRGTGFTKVWYFNATRDREIADIDTEGRICANPQTLQLFMGGK